MAYSLEQRFWCQRVLRFGFAFVCVCLCGYIVGPTSLLWRLKDKARPQLSCPSCVCDCSSHTDDFFLTPGLFLSDHLPFISLHHVLNFHVLYMHIRIWLYEYYMCVCERERYELLDL